MSLDQMYQIILFIVIVTEALYLERTAQYSTTMDHKLATP